MARQWQWHQRSIIEESEARRENRRIAFSALRTCSHVGAENLGANDPRKRGATWGEHQNVSLPQVQQRHGKITDDKRLECAAAAAAAAASRRSESAAPQPVHRTTAICAVSQDQQPRQHARHDDGGESTRSLQDQAVSRQGQQYRQAELRSLQAGRLPLPGRLHAAELGVRAGGKAAGGPQEVCGRRAGLKDDGGHRLTSCTSADGTSVAISTMPALRSRMATSHHRQWAGSGKPTP